MSTPSGSWPVMLTPFNSRLQIDWPAYAELINFYLRHQSTGLFATCLSSEVSCLDDDEKVKLAAEAVRYAGRVPVAAGAISFNSIEQQAELVKRIANTGAKVVVVSASQIAPESCDESEWQSRIEQLLHLTNPIPLGMYECPYPYHRILSAGMFHWLSQTGRFRFHKDTSCNPDAIKEKLDYVRDTHLGFFNAHTPTLLFSLDHGGMGYCGVGANFFPDLFAMLCRDHARHPEATGKLLEFINSAEPMIDFSYPVSAKHYLALRGVPIKPYCRLTDAVLTADQKTQLKALLNKAEKACQQYIQNLARRSPQPTIHA